MKLTQTQIEELKVFTKKHFVEWIDLQMELVDHLANGIEEQWETNPALTFEQCLQNEFAKFGVYGFMNVVENRREVLEKKYAKLIFQNFSEFFTFPKILVTIISIMMLFLVFNANAFGPKTKDIIMLTVGVVFMSVMIYNLLKRNKNASENKWLYEEILMGKSKFFVLGYLPVQILSTLANTENILANFIFALLTIFFSIIVYVMHFKIPLKVDQYLNDNYPEYRFYSTK